MEWDCFFFILWDNESVESLIIVYMQQKLLWAFCITGFSFFVSGNVALAKIGASCSVNDNTGVHLGICQAMDGNTCNFSAYPGREMACGSMDEICCFDSVPDAPAGDTGYTDPTPVSDANPVPVGGGDEVYDGKPCSGNGVTGVCKSKDPRACPAPSGKSRVRTQSLDCNVGREPLADPDWMCCTDQYQESNGLSDGFGASCTLTTGEGGACISAINCTTGFSSVAPCTAGGYVCCLITNSGSSGNFAAGSGSTPTSPTPSSSGGTGTPVAGGGGGSTGANRTGISTGSPATQGLYIPTKADTGLSDIPVTNLIQNFMKWLLYIVGFVAIIAFVISGIQYLLAAGSEEMAKKAKENMQYAIIGVIVALSGLIIIRAIQAVLLGAWIF